MIKNSGFWHFSEEMEAAKQKPAWVLVEFCLRRKPLLSPIRNRFFAEKYLFFVTFKCKENIFTSVVFPVLYDKYM